MIVVNDDLAREGRARERARVDRGRGGTCGIVWSGGGVCGAVEADGNAVFERDGGGPSLLLSGCEL